MTLGHFRARAGGALPAALRPFLRGGSARLLTDLVGYGLASAAALALDWSLLLALVGAGLHYLVASAVGFCAGMALAYGLSVGVVFRHRRRHTVTREAAAFFAIGAAGLILNQALLALFIGGFGLSVGVAKAPTAALVFSFNFLARRGLLFSRPSTTADP